MALQEACNVRRVHQYYMSDKWTPSQNPTLATMQCKH